MAERDVKEIKLEKSGKIVKVLTFLTEDENRVMLREFSPKVKMIDGKPSEENEADVEQLIRYKDAIIKSWVTEFDGSKDDINNRMRSELPSQDYNQVIDAVKEANEDEQKKTQ